jgi:aspartate/tyrosine/aromatic aminotransferase
VRHFASEGLELLVSQSFGKNMSLYGERIGFLSGVVSDGAALPAILSQLTLTVRPMVTDLFCRKKC